MSSGKRRKLCDVMTVVPLLGAGCCGSVSCRQAGRKLSAVPEGCGIFLPRVLSLIGK